MQINEPGPIEFTTEAEANLQALSNELRKPYAHPFAPLYENVKYFEADEAVSYLHSIDPDKFQEIVSSIAAKYPGLTHAKLFGSATFFSNEDTEYIVGILKELCGSERTYTHLMHEIAKDEPHRLLSEIFIIYPDMKEKVGAVKVVTKEKVVEKIVYIDKPVTKVVEKLIDRPAENPVKKTSENWGIFEDFAYILAILVILAIPGYLFFAINRQDLPQILQDMFVFCVLLLFYAFMGGFIVLALGLLVALPLFAFWDWLNKPTVDNKGETHHP